MSTRKRSCRTLSKRKYSDRKTQARGGCPADIASLSLTFAGPRAKMFLQLKSQGTCPASKAYKGIRSIACLTRL